MRQIAKTLAAAVLGGSMLVGTAGTASAAAQTTQPIRNAYANTGWTTYWYQFQNDHKNDDLGFDLHVPSNARIDARWRSCDGTQHGNIVRDIRGTGQGAVLIGVDFLQGSCVQLQVRALSGQVQYRTNIDGMAYFNYNIK